ncbi:MULTISPECIES: LacI family DNA-binding transcriptional regulator [unclassified Streptomyces]|uniref:LacI family DNA-binding transcriptional regulator n=1 Tax=unclassified Streptomyces TaxID=2593676 RepID=UPI00081E3D97|nr:MULTISPECIES: LacI family DNA-binding transcriptional regulator [unclassified Streptomyces]MYR94105.1 substrate-binding domain-containing protein [Streptomyces sp. SID4937]SCD65280.1 transcriptional regulator, LacI family [Streptomyces sp. ScaeMP-e83]
MAAARVRNGGRPTLEEVAARAGVGRGTASRVINGSPRVSEATREAVEAAVAELGYVPNRAARALAGNRTDAIALVVPEPETRFFAEPYFSAIVRGVGAALADTEMQLLLTLAGNDRERRRLAQYLTAHRVDGVLLVAVHADDPLPELLEQLGMPCVISGARHANEPLASVDSDNFEGARAAVDHLISRGRHSVATITGRLEVYGAQRRLDGYRAALAAAGLPPDERLIAPADFTEEGGARAMRELLARRPHLDAVFAASDVMAAGARQVLREADRRIPEDVALIGFDDSVVARHMHPALTSVRQPIEEMGRRMAQLLLEEIAGRTGERPTVVLPTELVVRDSS